jgi:hypothetical protein
LVHTLKDDVGILGMMLKWWERGKVALCVYLCGLLALAALVRRLGVLLVRVEAQQRHRTCRRQVERLEGIREHKYQMESVQSSFPTMRGVVPTLSTGHANPILLISMLYIYTI